MVLVNRKQRGCEKLSVLVWSIILGEMISNIRTWHRWTIVVLKKLFAIKSTPVWRMLRVLLIRNRIVPMRKILLYGDDTWIRLMQLGKTENFTFSWIGEENIRTWQWCKTQRKNMSNEKFSFVEVFD